MDNQVSLYPIAGECIGSQYEVLNIHATGSSRIAIDCKDKSTGQRVMVKRHFPDRMTKKLEKRIKQESLLQLKSDYVVKSEACFEYGGYLHSVEPFLAGISLRNSLIINNSFTEFSAIYTGICLCRACVDLHKIGILSTDVKPENAVVLPDGRVILIDLTFFEHIGRRAEISEGTIPYCPRELLQHDVLYPSTDFYAVSVVMFECLVGFDEFNTISATWDLAVQRGMKIDVSAIEKKYPRAFQIIFKGVEPDPCHRYQTADELLNELLAYHQSLTGFQPISCSIVKIICPNGRELCLKPGSYLIGRDHIDPRNYYISDKQFEISYDGTSLTIKDLDAVNKTQVNGTALKNKKSVTLNDSDTITVANVSVSVHIGAK